MDKIQTRYFITKVGAGSVYKTPDFNSECMTETVYGESNKILKYQKDWVYVKCEDGYKGWVNKFYGEESILKNNPRYVVAYPNDCGLFNPNFPFGSKVKKRLKGTIRISKFLGADNVISIASNLLNIPYKWGGKTSLGFDCSGLVQTIFKVCGFDIPRDAFEQKEFFKDCEIKLQDSKPGDLHFFGKKNKITHVACSTGGLGILHSQGIVKKESLNPKDDKFNKNLLDLYLSSNSLRLKFKI